MLNLVFFFLLPFLLLFKLCKKVTKCCKKNPDTKQKTETQDKSEEDDAKGPEVDIFKEGDILKDGSPRAQSSHSVKILTEHAEVKRGSKENVMTGTKRSHSASSTSSLVIKKSKHGSGDSIEASGSPHGSKHKMAAPGSRRSSREAMLESSASRGEVPVTRSSRSSHSYKNVAVEKTEPSTPQVSYVFVKIIVFISIGKTKHVKNESQINFTVRIRKA